MGAPRTLRGWRHKQRSDGRLRNAAGAVSARRGRRRQQRQQRRRLQRRQAVAHARRGGARCGGGAGALERRAARRPGGRAAAKPQRRRRVAAQRRRRRSVCRREGPKGLQHPPTLCHRAVSPPPPNRKNQASEPLGWPWNGRGLSCTPRPRTRSSRLENGVSRGGSGRRGSRIRSSDSLSRACTAAQATVRAVTWVLRSHC
jgi:hypothetical protein